MLNFYMDESGQDAKKAPLVVVGGFAIEAEKVAAFEETVKAHFQHCFGIIYDGSYELKGKDLLNTHKFLDAYSRAPRLGWLNDAERQHHCQIFMQGQPQIKPVAKDFVAKAQAGILFVEGLADLLEQFECSIFACATNSDEFKWHIKNGKNVNDSLLSMEKSIYSHYSSSLSSHFYADKTDDAADKKRAEYFNDHNFSNDSKLSFCDSKSTLNIQIADIIIYCINWGQLNASNVKHSFGRDEIKKLKLSQYIQYKSHNNLAVSIIEFSRPYPRP